MTNYNTLINKFFQTPIAFNYSPVTLEQCQDLMTQQSPCIIPDELPIRCRNK